MVWRRNSLLPTTSGAYFHMRVCQLAKFTATWKRSEFDYTYVPRYQEIITYTFGYKCLELEGRWTKLGLCRGVPLSNFLVAATVVI